MCSYIAIATSLKLFLHSGIEVEHPEFGGRAIWVWCIVILYHYYNLLLMFVYRELTSLMDRIEMEMVMGLTLQVGLSIYIDMMDYFTVLCRNCYWGQLWSCQEGYSYRCACDKRQWIRNHCVCPYTIGCGIHIHCSHNSSGIISGVNYSAQQHAEKKVPSVAKYVNY